jgi:hypothetical protein
VGIDRPDEDDAPTVEHDSPLAERDTPEGEPDSPAVDDHGTSPDSEADRAAYITNFRADVVAEYAWAEAMPEFQATWEEHVRRYPHPERSRPAVHDDGSWSADGDRKLSPEQNAEVDRYTARFHEIGKNVIVPALRNVEAEDSCRHLVGLQHCFKDADRLKEKVADRLRSKPGRTPGQALEMIPDTVRFTLQYDNNSYTAGVRKDIERLEARGFVQLESRGTWTSDQYKGINSRWEEPESRQSFEVQFHTRISYEAKELTHKAYERIRSTAEDHERTELKDFQRKVCATIPVPPGATEIEDYRLEKLDG